MVDDLSNGFSANVPGDVKLVAGNACDERVLEKLPGGFDAIFHLAAVSSVQDSLNRPVAAHDSNLTATLCLLEFARRHGIKRFVFSSSAAVYGDAGEKPIREDSPPSPLSHYAVQKLASEYYCGVYHRLYGSETVCLRYFNVFGPRQRADSPYSGVITRFIAAARAGQPLVIFGDGSQSRDFVPVSSIVEANLAAATVEAGRVAGDSFNIGSGRSLTVKELADHVRRHFPDLPPHEYRPRRDGEIHHSQADITGALGALHFKPPDDFEKALLALLQVS